LRTLVVGTCSEAGRLVEILRTPGSGFLPLGYARALDASRALGPANGLPVLGGIDELDRLVQEEAADCVFVASKEITLEEMARVSQTARQTGIEVRVLANLPQTLTSRLSLLKVGPAIALALKPVRLSGRQATAKRAFDLALASAALVVSFPLWVVIAVAIGLDSRGPVFFHQERVTRDGRIFRMHKFRSMRTDVDAALDTTRPFFKLQSDPRLTRVGAFLRRFSLDELPQFWNVLVGEMSIVGPRPLPADQVAANPELLSPRHVVPAGVTGWWQTNGRSGVTPEEALRLDLFYIENWSLTLDMYIVLKTFGAVVGRQGAY
jgi:exopolysaccharide biosynthesis polyprenyl glycosylphosphotransferase